MTSQVPSILKGGSILPEAVSSSPYAILNQIVEFEEGNLDHEETIALVQALIDNGMAWTLQGTYGRMAAHFIEEGLCHEEDDEESKRLELRAGQFEIDGGRG